MRPVLALGALLALGAALRFIGLSAGLRHIPHLDERYFVENVGWMLVERDLDHRFQEYPGLFFYLLAPVLSFFGPPRFGPSAYLAARAVVAAAGTASIALVFALGRRLGVSRAALFAAALLAVSPVGVYTAHEVRPDVVLEAFVLLAFLAIVRVGPGLRSDGMAGAALGAATAVKFSGVLLAPSYVAQRLLTPGLRLRGTLLAAGLSLAAFALLSPYSLLHFDALVGGVSTQVGYHYVPREGEGWTSMAFTYLRVLVKAVGIPALGLLALGLARFRGEWRRYLPLALFPLVTIGVFSTAEVHHDRFLVPALGVVALLAGLGLEGLPARAAALLAAGALAVPLAGSVQSVIGLHAPSTRDQALDWIDARYPLGSRLLTTVEGLGLDPLRYEVLRVDRLEGLQRLLVRNVQALVTEAAANEPAVAALPVAAAFAPRFPESGVAVAVRAAPPAPYERLALRDDWITSSQGPEGLGRLNDGDLSTAWRTRAEQRPGDSVQVLLAEPRLLARVELVLGRHTRLFPRNVYVFLTEDGTRWARVPVVHGRPPLESQLAASGPASEVLLFAPVRARGIRLVQVGVRARPWAVAELHLDVLP